MGPVVPYENGIIKDAYDPRRLIRNTVLPQAIPPYCLRRSTTKPDRSDHAGEAERDLQPKPTQYVAGKLAPDIAIDINASPFYHSRTVKADPVDDRIVMDTNLLQAKSQFGGISAAAAATAAHRKVGAVQFGMTRMY